MKSICSEAMDISKLTNPRKVELYLDNEKWLIRQESIKKLGEIGDSKSIKRLIKILKTSKDNYDIIYAISARKILIKKTN